MITANEWADYQSLMSAFNDMFGQKDIVWRRAINLSDDYNEAPLESAASQFQVVTLKGLINDNYIRTWPVNPLSETGELDRQSIQIYFHLPYLRNLNYAVGNNFTYNFDHDRFVIDGLVYKPVGDTPTAQAGASNIWFTLICRREEKLEGT